MTKLSEWNRSRSGTALVFGSIFSLMLILNIHTPYICDDFTYRLNFATGEPLESLWEIFPSMYAHSFKMNGRLISHGLVQLFMLLPPLIFDVCNALIFTATGYAIHRLCDQARNGLLFGAMFCLLWLFMPAFGQVALWQVGAINYFWSLTGCAAFFAPELLRFRDGKVLLDRVWKQGLFCLYAFFFGWYNEIASFVGICMVFCLVVLDVWMNRTKFRVSRLLPLVFAAAGYLVMLSMPAQAANKQAGSLTLDALIQRFSVCCGMLLKYGLGLVLLFAVLFLIGLRRKLPGKTMVLSGLFALAGICANFMPIAASYYPERCMCTTVLMLLMAIGFLAAPLFRDQGFPVLTAACILVLLLTLPSGIRGCRDIASCHRQHLQRERTIATALANGETEVTANTVTPLSPYSGYWGLRDLVDDPETWPNHSMALYYGLDSLTGE